MLTRDLRVHDNPRWSVPPTRRTRVVPLFVLDDAILRSGFNRPNRARFLLECLRDLDASLRRPRRRAGGAPRRLGRARCSPSSSETGATSVHVAGDVTAVRPRPGRAAGRPARLTASSWWCTTATLFVVPPGDVTAAGKDHMAVFTPYFRRWQREPHPRPGADAAVAAPAGGLARGRLPAVGDTGGR